MDGTLSSDASSPRWLAAGSPFAPLIKRPFSDGLGVPAFIQSLDLERRGQCNEVMTLVQQGFIGLYPKLKLIFLENPVLRLFERIIVPAVSNRYRRCMAWHNLNIVLEHAKRRALGSTAPYLDMPFADFKFFSVEKTDWDELYGRAFFEGLNGLVRLGLCERDKAALKDLNDLTDRLYWQVFSESEALYMDAAAAEHGVITAHFKRVKQKLKGEKAGDPISLEPQKLFSMQARLEVHDMMGAKALIPSPIKICEYQTLKP